MRRTWMAIGFSTLTALVFSLLAGSASSQVFPIRFEEAAAVAPDVIAGVEVLDPHTQRVLTDNTVGSNSEVVPLATLIEYCADGDGCRVRMFRAFQGDGEDRGLRSFLFSISTDGDDWRARNHDSTPISEGRRNNGNYEVIAALSVISEDGCIFADSTSNQFRLSNVSELIGPQIDCAIRIED